MFHLTTAHSSAMNSLQRPRLLHDWTNEGKSDSAAAAAAQRKVLSLLNENPSRRKLDSFKSSPISTLPLIDSFSPESLFLTQIGKAGVSNLLMLRYVKEGDYSRETDYLQPLTTHSDTFHSASSWWSCSEENNVTLSIKKRRKVSSLVGKMWKKRDLPREMTTEQSGGRPAWSRSGSSRWWEQKYSPLTRRNAVLLPPHVWRHMGLYIAFRPTFFSPFCTLGTRSAHQ